MDRQHTPAATRTNKVADRVDHFAKIHLARTATASRLGHQRRKAIPFLISQITGIALCLLGNLGHAPPALLCPHAEPQSDCSTSGNPFNRFSKQPLRDRRSSVRPYVRSLAEGGSPYTVVARVARIGRADPHRRRTSRGAFYRSFRRNGRGKDAERDCDCGRRTRGRGSILGGSRCLTGGNATGGAVDRRDARTRPFLLRSRTDRLWPPPVDHLHGLSVRHRRTFTDTKATRRQGEDQPARRGRLGQAPARGGS